MEYYRLLIGVNKGKIIMLDPRLDFDHFEYSFHKKKWIDTNIFVTYMWPEDDEFGQYEKITLAEAKKTLKKQEKELAQLLILAEKTAREAHEGQTDIGGEPYINHPEFVASQVDEPEQKIIAWLHDVLEDTDLTEVDLRELGFPESIIHSIKLLTKSKDIYYEEYLWKLKSNNNAKEVKLADLKHNMDTSRLGRKLKKRDKERLEKYEKATDFLNNTNYDFF